MLLTQTHSTRIYNLSTKREEKKTSKKNTQAHTHTHTNTHSFATQWNLIIIIVLISLYYLFSFLPFLLIICVSISDTLHNVDSNLLRLESETSGKRGREREFNVIYSIDIFVCMEIWPIAQHWSQQNAVWYMFVFFNLGIYQGNRNSIFTTKTIINDPTKLN